MKPRKILLTLLAFLLLAKAASLLSSYYVSATTPSIVEETEKKAKNSKLILSKIGGYRGLETHYNENDFNDSVARFSVKIIGTSSNVTLNLRAQRKLRGDWIIIQSDTLYYKFP